MFDVIRSSIRRSKTKMKSDLDLPYEVRQVPMRTCAQLYRKWRNTYFRYRNAPIDGIEVQVEYVDVLPKKRNPLNPPLVALCLHGAPGSHRDFRHLIAHLTSKNIRVIAPNFPDYKLTKRTALFVHSAEEKAEYIKDFLNAIKLNRVDLLICHSSSIFPASILVSESLDSFRNGITVGMNLLNPTISIGSMVLLNPCTQRSFKQLRPLLRHGVFRPSAFLYQLRASRVVIRFCGRFVLDIFGSPVDYNNFDNVMLTLTTILNCRHKKMAPRMMKIVNNGLPLVVVFSERDRLLPKEHFYSFARMLGIDEIGIDHSEASHRSRNTSNETSQEQLNKTPPSEINNNFDKLNINLLKDQQEELQEKFENLKFNEQSEDEFEKQIQNLEKRLKSRFNNCQKMEKDEEDKNSLIYDDQSDLSNTSLDSCELISSKIVPEKSIGGTKFAISISKAGHYSLITHSHVISQQIDKLIKLNDLRKSAIVPSS